MLFLQRQRFFSTLYDPSHTLHPSNKNTTYKSQDVITHLFKASLRQHHIQQMLHIASPFFFAYSLFSRMLIQSTLQIYPVNIPEHISVRYQPTLLYFTQILKVIICSLSMLYQLMGYHKWRHIRQIHRPHQEYICRSSI